MLCALGGLREVSDPHAIDDVLVLVKAWSQSLQRRAGPVTLCKHTHDPLQYLACLGNS